MKILEKLPKFANIPRIIIKLNLDEEEYKAMVSKFPLKITRALKDIFETGNSISIAAKSNKTSVQLIRYYLQKMHKMKFNKYYGDN